MKKINKGGGLKAIKYSLRASFTTGLRKMYRALSTKNSCKSCALGMGGQKGGMTDEMGRFPEVCKKAFQAQITDIQDPIPPDLFKKNSISDFKNMSGRLIERSGRLNNPLYKAKGDSHYSTISWDKALDKVSGKFKDTAPNRSFFYSSGRSSNESGFLMQLFARIYGSNNVNNTSYYCHQASGVGISSVIGTGTATIVLEDLEKSDLIFVIGANPASNHPRFMRQLLNCRRRGGDVIIINPAKETGLVRFGVPSSFRSMLTGGSDIASEYIQVNIGGDIALLKGIAKYIIETKKQDNEFLKNHTNGSEEYISDIRNTSWDLIVSGSGISKNRIEDIAKIYSKSKYTVFSWALGITHHEHGVDNVESIVNLALLRGMIGKPFAGLLPLRGHSNVQGIGSVGVTPVLKEEILKNLEKVLDIKLPDDPGFDTMSGMKASFNNDIDLGFFLGGNLYGSNPDTKFAVEALNNIPFKIYLTTTLNNGHFYGVDEEVIILPVAARDEEFQKTTQESMFNFVRLSDGGIKRLNNIRSEVNIISDIGYRVFGENSIDFRKFADHKTIRELIAKVVPGYKKIGNLDNSGEEFQISNRTYHLPVFATPDSKANMRLCSIPSVKRGEDEFCMMTVRSEGQFNTIIYDESDLYRNQKSRWVVLMNKDDIHDQGLVQDDKVNIESSTGIMEKVTVSEFDICRGNIMTYFPEANVLVSTRTDPRSKTPGYKQVLVKVSKSTFA